MKERIVIVDGNSLINRAYFAMSELKNSKGLYTGGIHGLTSMVLSLIESFDPKYFCVAFDMKGPTFRHLTYDAYKGTRKGMPDELAMQMPVVKEILDVLRIPRIELSGFEADDLIGTVAKNAIDLGIEANVITGDKDALQLVAMGVKVHITKKGITNLQAYDEFAVFEELGVHANQVIDYKGLSGDASDNIPGIPSIGPKTAAKLLATFGTVESLIERSDEIENKRIRGLVDEFAEQALLSKRLATIVTEVPVDFDFSFLELSEPNLEEAVAAFKHYELNQLLSRLKVKTETTSKVETVSYLNSKQLLEMLNGSNGFAFKLFYERIGIQKNTLMGAAFFVNDGFYLLENLEGLIDLKEVFESIRISKYGYDVKKEYLYLMQMGIDLNGMMFDGYIAAYLIDPARRTYDLADLVFEHQALKITSEEDLLGKGAKKVKLSDVSNDTFNQFMLSQMRAIVALKSHYEPILEKMNLKRLLHTVEMPLVKILADIEFTGFKVDVSQVDLIDAQLIQKIDEMETSIYEMAGESFNINSPKQLGVILFDKLALPSGKKTKTGYSTGHDVLEKLMNKHPIVNEIIEYRMYTKLKSTYIDGLRVVIDPDSHRVHTSLNQTVTVTGRLSSTEPNLQNIPIRLPYGRKVRRFFIADEGCTLLDADYSQIELRVLAHLSKDEKLVEAFKNDLDIHTLTASQVFHIKEEEVTSLQRSRAKEVNFGIVYGMGDFGLSESLDISRKDAKTYIENYFMSYPKVKTFMDEIIENCKEDGYVETILNRRRTVEDINHSNFMMRSAAERIARNTPIQGSAADIIKLAMIKVYQALKAGNYRSKLILQVHDELILNVPFEELEAIKDLLKVCMEDAYALCVPLKIDMNTGASWYDAK